jgi:hypothetical protein
MFYWLLNLWMRQGFSFKHLIVLLKKEKSFGKRHHISNIEYSFFHVFPKEVLTLSIVLSVRTLLKINF